MTDVGLVLKRVALVEGWLADLRGLEDPAAIETDVRIERFVEHTLQLAIQATQDVAAHIVADEGLGAPATNRELFNLLARHGWVDGELAPRLGAMAGFRNVLVHGYVSVDPSIVRRVVERDLGDLVAFVACVRQRLAGD